LKEFLLPGVLSFFVHSLFLGALFLMTQAGSPFLKANLSNFSKPAFSSPVHVVDLQPEGEWRKPLLKEKKSPETPLPPSPPPVEPSVMESAPSPNKPAADGGYLSIGQVSQRPSFKVKVIPSLPEAAKRANIEGVVILQVDIDASGTVKKVELIKGLGYGCDEAAIDALKRSVLNPATLGSQAVPVKQWPLKYIFHFDY
jgi:TonB family protein